MDRLISEFLKHQKRWSVLARSPAAVCTSAMVQLRVPESVFASVLETCLENRSVLVQEVREWRDVTNGNNVVHFLACQNDPVGIAYVVSLCGADPYLQRFLDLASPLHVAEMHVHNRKAARFLEALPGYQTPSAVLDNQGRNAAQTRKIFEQQAEKTGTLLMLYPVLTAGGALLELACVALDANLNEVFRWQTCVWQDTLEGLNEVESQRLNQNGLVEQCTNAQTSCSLQGTDQRLLRYLERFCVAPTYEAQEEEQFTCKVVQWSWRPLRMWLSGLLPLCSEFLKPFSVLDMTSILEAAHVAQRDPLVRPGPCSVCTRAMDGCEEDVDNFKELIFSLQTQSQQQNVSLQRSRRVLQTDSKPCFIC